jgi:DNA invertase Pin-like site-specific DNA recombinase
VNPSPGGVPFGRRSPSKWVLFPRRNTVHIVITTLGIDLKTPAGRLVFGMMAQIAEFERELIRDRVVAGMAEAKARGQHLGRRHTLRPNQRAEAARLHLEEGKSIGQIAALFGCGRTVVHRAIHAQQTAA